MNLILTTFPTTKRNVCKCLSIINEAIGTGINKLGRGGRKEKVRQVGWESWPGKHTGGHKFHQETL